MRRVKPKGTGVHGIWTMAIGFTAAVLFYFMIHKVVQDESSVGSIVAANYKMIETTKLVRQYLELNLKFTAIKAAKEVNQEWDNFNSQLIADFNPMAPRVGVCSDLCISTLTIKGITVNGKEITVVYDYDLNYLGSREMNSENTIKIDLPCADYYQTESECPAVCQWNNDKCTD